MKHNYSQHELDNHANQLNPNHQEYQGSNSGRDESHDHSNDNHADQLNPNNDEYKGDKE